MKKGLFWLLDVIILVMFLKLIDLSFNLTGIPFKLQFFGLLFLILLGLIVMFSNTGKLNVLFFTLTLVDLMLIYGVTGFNFTYIIVPTGAAILGMFISLLHDDNDYESNDDEMTQLEEPPEKPETEVLLEEYESNKETKYSPGKFVASKFGKTYHAAKCDWATKIKTKNQVWFNTKKDATKKGYEAHNCV